jgi:hypothetical protein
MNAGWNNKPWRYTPVCFFEKRRFNTKKMDIDGFRQVLLGLFRYGRSNISTWSTSTHLDNLNWEKMKMFYLRPKRYRSWFIISAWIL